MDIFSKENLGLVRSTKNTDFCIKTENLKKINDKSLRGRKRPQECLLRLIMNELGQLLTKQGSKPGWASTS